MNITVNGIIYTVLTLIILGVIWKLLHYIAARASSPPVVATVIDVSAALLGILILVGLLGYGPIVLVR